MKVKINNIDCYDLNRDLSKNSLCNTDNFKTSKKFVDNLIKIKNSINNSTSSKKLNKIVCLDNNTNIKNISNNFNDITYNTKTKSKCKVKGKIHSSRFWTAYNRENLGSIPSKTENIIINNSTKYSKKGFLCNTNRFDNKDDKIKNNYPGPGSYNNFDNTSLKTEHSTVNGSFNTSLFSSKGFGNGFASTTVRFDDYNEYKNKFQPSPFDYSNANTMYNRLSKNLMHKSLYNNKKTFSLNNRNKLQSPGPGYYKPLLFKDYTKINNSIYKNTKIKKHLISLSNNHIALKTDISTSSSVKSKKNTFVKSKELNSQLTTTYCTTNNSSKNSCNNFKFFNKTEGNSITINNVTNQGIYESNKPNEINNAKEASLISKDYISNYCKSYYRNYKLKEKIIEEKNKLISLGVKDDSNIPENKILKNIIKDKYSTKINNYPGPGSYNLSNELGQKEKKLMPHERYFIFQKTMYNERIKEINSNNKNLKNKYKNMFNNKMSNYNNNKDCLSSNNTHCKDNIPLNDYYSTYSCFNMDKKLSPNYNFISKSPKIEEKEHKIPGPCYYSPRMLPYKTSYNINKEKNWIS